VTAVCPVLAGQQFQVGVDQRPRRDQIIQFLLTAHDTTLAPPAAASNNTTAERRHDLIKNLAAWDSYPSAGLVAPRVTTPSRNAHPPQPVTAPVRAFQSSRPWVKFEARPDCVAYSPLVGSPSRPAGPPARSV